MACIITIARSTAACVRLASDGAVFWLPVSPADASRALASTEVAERATAAQCDVSCIDYQRRHGRRRLTRRQHLLEARRTRGQRAPRYLALLLLVGLFLFRSSCYLSLPDTAFFGDVDVNSNVAVRRKMPKSGRVDVKRPCWVTPAGSVAGYGLRATCSDFSVSGITLARRKQRGYV